MTYYATFTLLLVLRLFERGRKPFGLYWPVLIGLFMFSAFRFEVGCDWNGYLFNFWAQQGRGYLEAVQRINPAHWVLLETLDQLSLAYHWLNIVTSAIFFAGLHAIARRSPAPLTMLVLAFPVLILNIPMSAVKQAAAIGLLCFAFNAFIDRRPIRFVGWLMLATTFHGSALMFLLLTPFITGRYTLTNFIFSVILALPLAGVILSSESAEVATVRYIEGDKESAGAIFRLSLTFMTGLFYVFFLSKRWANVLPESHKLVSLLSFGMIGIALLIPVSTVIADRLGYNFMIPQLMIYAALPALYPGNKGAFVKIAPFAAFLVLFVGWTQLSSHYRWCYVPYSII